MTRCLNRSIFLSIKMQYIMSIDGRSIIHNATRVFVNIAGSKCPFSTNIMADITSWKTNENKIDLFFECIVIDCKILMYCFGVFICYYCQCSQFPMVSVDVVYHNIPACYHLSPMQNPSLLNLNIVASCWHYMSPKCLRRVFRYLRKSLCKSTHCDSEHLRYGRCYYGRPKSREVCWP